MVSQHLFAEVCSIYYYNPLQGDLSLKTTVGLSKEAVGITLKLGEGIVGAALKELRVIAEASGQNNPNFRFFPGTNEEKYEAILAVPILRGNIRIGVIVVQRQKNYPFNSNDI